MNFIIRRADLGDAAGIAEVHINSWKTTYAGIIPVEILINLDNDERTRRWREIISDPDGKQAVFVVESDDGRIIGFASAEAERSGDPVYEGEISAIYLLEEYQRLGIGRRLFSVAAQELSSRGFRSLLVRVLTANSSYRFYEALGGMKLGEGEAHISGVAYSDVAYGWKDIREVGPLSGERMADTRQFYDDLASYYHLIFENWDASMVRQGNALAHLINAELGQVQPRDVRILDAACGIGTQTLPLAALGFRLVARDLSPAAVSRLKGEAKGRQLDIDAAVADMRQVASSVSGSFDAVLAFDNSVSHLLNDEDLRTAFNEFLAVLRPGGVFLCSVRDYDKVQRGERATHVYDTRLYHGERFHLRQEWSWDDPMHYQATFIIDKETVNGLARELRTESQFYAVTTGRLLELMRDVGFTACRRIDEAIYQPILAGRRAA